jgi:hypothetical protein
MHGERDDDDGRIERPDRFHTQKLKAQPSLHRLPESNDARLSGAAQLACLRRQTFPLAGELLRVSPSQTHPSPASPIRQPVEGELGETEPLW